MVQSVGSPSNQILRRPPPWVWILSLAFTSCVTRGQLVTQPLRAPIYTTRIGYMKASALSSLSYLMKNPTGSTMLWEPPPPTGPQCRFSRQQGTWDSRRERWKLPSSPTANPAWEIGSIIPEPKGNPEIGRDSFGCKTSIFPWGGWGNKLLAQHLFNVRLLSCPSSKLLAAWLEATEQVLLSIYSWPQHPGHLHRKMAPEQSWRILGLLQNPGQC